MIHAISWSGGKDSTATVILFHEHQNEILKSGDGVVILFSEVMFDKVNNISGHNPDVIKFIYQAKERFESWGYKVEILHSDKDYFDVFFHKLTRSPDPERIGKPYGFVRAGICSVKRDCKLKPINDWYKAHKDVIQYVGIAIDEPDRLESLRKQGCISLLEKYGYTERDAMDLCEAYDLVSPQYELNAGKQKRDGCWFCPHAKLCEHRAIYEAHPDAWARYVALENIPNLAYKSWNPYTTETLHDRDDIIRNGAKQISIFDLLDAM